MDSYMRSAADWLVVKMFEDEQVAHLSRDSTYVLKSSSSAVACVKMQKETRGAALFIHHARASERLHEIYENKSICEISLHAVCPTTAVDSAAPSLTLALVRCPCDAVGRLPGLVIVERCTALAVVAGRVVSAHTLPLDLLGRQHTHTHTKERGIWSLTHPHALICWMFSFSGTCEWLVKK